MLDCQLFGLNPGRHHLVNLLNSHCQYPIALYRLKTDDRSILAKCFCRSFICLHPLHVESVAWISERKDVLSTLFWLLTMAAYLRYVEKIRCGLVSDSIAAVYVCSYV